MTDMTGKIAIIGMAGRFPGCPDMGAFWAALIDGQTPLTRFAPEDLEEAPAHIVQQGGFVPEGFCLEDIDKFDAHFFGYSAAEAARLDPQQRIFLETCWHGLEDAGAHTGDTQGRRTGVYGAANFDSYGAERFSHAPMSHPEAYLRDVLASDKDYLATRVAHKLDLHGPAITVQTACSSSLVAISMAVTDLLTWGCDLAIAGGVGVRARQKIGYLRDEDGALTAPGGCRPFDAGASGMIDGSGAGVVVLRRLEDAVENGDRIYAVISGVGLSNDGARKSTYTAPSAAGQAQAIATALEMAGRSGDQIGLIETHGTGTPIGDPIEYAALVQALGSIPGRDRILGALKANFGHMSAGAGVAGVIKTALALYHETIPPHPRFDTPNPRCPMAQDGFAVNTTARSWPRTAEPRVAGVSSFGIGGTNAHVIVEEAPRMATRPSGETRRLLIPVSGRSPEAVAAIAARLETSAPLDRVARSLTSRTALAWRRCVAASGTADAIRALRHAPTRHASPDPKLVFAFSGIGRADPTVGRGLYQDTPAFRARIDEIIAVTRQYTDTDLAPFFIGTQMPQSDARAAMLAHFALQLGLVAAYAAHGIEPDAMIGHSLGEYAVAHTAGVLSLSQAVQVIALRADLLLKTAEGGMCLVPADIGTDLAQRPGIDIAGWNTPAHVTLAAPADVMADLKSELRRKRVAIIPLAATRAGHSAMLDPILPEFEAALSQMPLKRPVRPYISNLTGTWANPDQVCTPQYWVGHLRQPVRFSQGIEGLAQWGATAIVDIGPGGGLAPVLRRHPAMADCPIIPALPDHQSDTPEAEGFAHSLADLWATGHAENLPAQTLGDARAIPFADLPLYPFRRDRHWTPAHAAPAPAQTINDDLPILPEDAWLHRTSWCQYEPVPTGTAAPVFILSSDGETGQRLADALDAKLIDTIGALGDITSDSTVICTTPLDHIAPQHGLDAQAACLCRDHIADIIRAAARTGRKLRIIVLTRGLACVTGQERLAPAFAILQGVVLCAPHENPHLGCEMVDIDGTVPDNLDLLGRIVRSQPAQTPLDATLALRMGQVWRQELRQAAPPPPAAITPEGHFIIIGADGGVGRSAAERLAHESPNARIVMLVREHPDRGPDRDAFGAKLRAHGADLLWVTADLTDLAATQQALHQAKAWLCTVTGIVHAAGVAGGGLIEAALPEGGHSNIGPKLLALAAIETVFADTDMDFLILSSSVGASFGAAGQADNMGANRVLALFAQSRHLPRCRHKMAIGWDYWRDTGMIRVLGPRHKELTGHEIRHGMTALQGQDWIMRCLGAAMATPVVSTLPADWMRAQLRQRLGDAMATYEAAHQPALKGRAERPALPTTYAEPEGQAETLMAEFWAEALGFDRVGRHDSFLELGGDSLAALPLLARMREAFDCDIPVSALYKTPTIAGCAAHIHDKTNGAAEIRARIYLTVMHMSDAEISAEIAKKGDTTPQQKVC